MSRFRVIAVIVFAFAFAGLRGHSQTQIATRILLDRFGPTALERGISPIEGRSPDGTRRIVRPMTGSLDRIGASGAHYRAGRVIVKFKDGTPSAARVSAASASSQTASISVRPDYADFDLVSIDPAEDAEAVARSFAARPDVEYAQAAYRVHAQLTPNDRFYPQQWNLPLIQLDRAWDIQPAAGSSITVAVIDTGIAYTSATMRFHGNAFRVNSNGDVVSPNARGTLFPALGDLTLSFVAATELGPSSRFVAPHDFVWNDATPVDLEGHGTHVAGTIGQLTNNGTNGAGDTSNGGGTAGVAFNVKLMPIKVLAGEWDVIFGAAPDVGGSDDDVARGIRYAADNGAKVINMSLGSSGPAGSDPVIESAIKYAVGKGVFVAVAGGNDFESRNPTEVVAEIASRVPGAVSVAAVDRSKGRAYYSSTGTFIELAAPGGSFRGFPNEGGILQQTLDLALVETWALPLSQFSAPQFDALAYYYFTGTSMATPHVAGVAAMLMQQGITDPAAVEGALEKFATPCSEARNLCDSTQTANRNNSFGFGLVDARNALRGLGLAR